MGLIKWFRRTVHSGKYCLDDRDQCITELYQENCMLKQNLRRSKQQNSESAKQISALNDLILKLSFEIQDAKDSIFFDMSNRFSSSSSTDSGIIADLERSLKTKQEELNRLNGIIIEYEMITDEMKNHLIDLGVRLKHSEKRRRKVERNRLNAEITAGYWKDLAHRFHRRKTFSNF